MNQDQKDAWFLIHVTENPDITATEAQKTEVKDAIDEMPEAEDLSFPLEYLKNKLESL